MKVERISEKQVRFILTSDDLEGRNIMLTELINGSENIYELMQDMMRRAYEECNFQADNVPLMIEVGRAERDSIMVIITKMDSFDEIENKINKVPRLHQFINNLAAEAKNKAMKNAVAKTEETFVQPTTFVYSFDNIDQLSNLATRLYGIYTGSSSLYKYNNKFYLIALNEGLAGLTSDVLELMLNEYGTKHQSSYLFKQYLLEHGEIIIKNSALDKLAVYL